MNRYVPSSRFKEATSLFTNVLTELTQCLSLAQHTKDEREKQLRYRKSNGSEKEQKHFQFFSLGSQDNTVHSGSTHLYSCQLVEYFSGNDTSQSALCIFREKMGREFSDQISCLASAGS